MNVSISLDQQIFTDVLGFVVDDPHKIPPYTTDLDCAYKVIKKLQQTGWVFGAKAINHQNGELSFSVQFVHGKQRVVESRSSLSLAICHASICVIKEQWTEFVDDSDHSITTLPIIHNIRELFVEENDAQKSLLSYLDNVLIPVDNKENGLTLKQILNYLLIKRRITENDLDELPQRIVQAFLDGLDRDNMLIIKKHNESK